MSKTRAKPPARSELTATPAVRVLIVEDHELMRAGLQELIQTQSNWQVCGEACDEKTGLKQFRKNSPDLVIVDLALHDSSGLDLIRSIKQTNTTVRVLVLSMHDEKLYAERALRAGADGFINKQQPSREILRAIHRVLEGGIYLSEKMSGMLLQRVAHGKGSLERSPVEQLSNRELEIFTLIGRGLTTDDIANRLHLSPNTIGTYRERLKTKLDLSSSNELNRLAMQWVMEVS